MGRYDFSSQSVFQIDIIFDAMLSCVVALVLALSIGRWIVRTVFDDSDPTFVIALSPAVGLAAFMLLADWTTRIAGFGLILPVATATAAAALFAQLRQSNPRTVPRTAIVLIAGAALVALLPPLWLLPRFSGDAMSFGLGLYDHLKTALIDAIAREGMPARTPYVSIDGEAVALNYYYGWHLLAASIRTIPNVSSLGADVGLAWLTGFASLMATAGLAWRLRPSVPTIIATLAVMAGSTYRIIYDAVLPNTMAKVFGSLRHPLEGFMVQAAWVPQHVASATFVVIGLYLVAQLLTGAGDRRLAVTALLGAMLAAAVMCSVWVGGVALALTALVAAPFFLTNLYLRARIWPAAPVLALGAALTLIFASGFLLYLYALAQASAQSIQYVSFWIYQTSDVVDVTTVAGIIFNTINFFTVYAVTHLGPLYVAGLYGLYAAKHHDSAERGLIEVARIWVPAVLCMVFFLRSSLINNELGWRGLLIAVLLLAIFAGPVLGGLYERWHRAGSSRQTRLIASGACLALLLSSISSYLELRRTVTADPGTAEYAQHTRMLDAGRVWARVQHLTPPHAIVMSAPEPFERITRPGGNAAWALFSDRRALITDYEWAIVFAHHMAEPQIDARNLMQSAVFAGHATSTELAILKTREKVAAIVVTPMDKIINTDFLVRGGHFRLAERLHGFEIYLPTAP